MTSKDKSHHIGYIRVSTVDQNTDRQLDGVHLDKTFTDKLSGKDTKRPGLQECLNYVREGDTLHVHSMDRLARNLIDLQKMVDDLTARGVYVQFHKEKLTFTNEVDKMATLMLQIMGAVADFERALIKERQREGMAKAKQTGKHLGRNFSLSMKQVKEAQSMVEAGETKTKVAEYFGISRQSLYRNLDRSIIQDFESQK